ncbi:MAG: M48 family metalloprotease [Rhodospirillales bacterium]|nr:M48 family metalloprotease [Rhodospirillales bacterium]
MKRLFRFTALIPLLLTLLFLGACSTNPATGKQTFTAFMSRDDELRVGAEEHPKLIKSFGGAYTDAKLRAYIRRTGLKLAALSEASSLPFTFTILNDDRVNALALPGGYIYITRGLLALAGNEAEMAGVLAHEIGHVTARHTAERYSATMATNLGLIVLGAIGSAAGVPAGVGDIVGYGAQAALQGYSREQELEADKLGVRYMTRAGYDPAAMTSFFHKMAAHAELERALEGKTEAAANNIMATHPRTAQRIDQAIKLERTARGAVGQHPVLGRDGYLAEIDGMVFGDDPEQGIRKGRDFIHPGLGIRFTVPPEFVLFNSPSQVVARGPDKAVVIFDLAPAKSAKGVRSLPDYLTGVWGRNLTLSDVSRLNVNGLQAATATARGRGRDGLRDIRLIVFDGGQEGDKNRIFRFAFVTPTTVTAGLNTELRRTTYSFRRLTDAEAKAIRPLKIKVANVRPGDTRQTFARLMPFEKFRERWFDVLNGLKPGEKLIPGRKVKTVSE